MTGNTGLPATDQELIEILQHKIAEQEQALQSLRERLTLKDEEREVLAGDHDGKVYVQPLIVILRRVFGEQQVSEVLAKVGQRKIAAAAA